MCATVYSTHMFVCQWQLKCMPVGRFSSMCLSICLRLCSTTDLLLFTAAAGLSWIVLETVCKRTGWVVGSGERERTWGVRTTPFITDPSREADRFINIPHKEHRQWPAPIGCICLVKIILISFASFPVTQKYSIDVIVVIMIELAGLKLLNTLNHLIRT